MSEGKRQLAVHAVSVLAICTLGNFVLEAFTDLDWKTAIEHSYFQALILAAFVLSADR